MKNSYALSYLALRKIVGFLGITFPIILILGAIAFGACKGVQASISDYHNTSMRDVFTGILCAMSLFLFAYAGYDKLDFWMAKLCGILGFMVAIFPDGLDDNECTIYVNQIIPPWMEKVHLYSAGAFFLVLAYFSIFLFTKSNKATAAQTAQKKKRNLIYKICGYIMVVCIVILLLYFQIPGLKEKFEKYSPVLFLEIIALWAFGFSWLVKGETILKDK
ncbi:MAG: hypothetical protein Q7W45_01585 [Bacteroidota bacterium]|nr:hypothetical protein [Bacteroidota bacterium]MDP3146539.1 hypothetical protein [Bacteroidota bacterium]MDP3555738.1 hypothetical protein [Bacteroidota bacterium]